jgi:uncharacterized DUF497 family protein
MVKAIVGQRDRYGWSSGSASTRRGFALVQQTLARIGKDIRGVIAVVFVTLGKEAVSVISMRPANRYERELYAER